MSSTLLDHCGKPRRSHIIFLGFSIFARCLSLQADLPECYRVSELDYRVIGNSTNELYEIYSGGLTDSGKFTGYIYYYDAPYALLYYSPETDFVDLGRWHGLATRGFGINDNGQISVRASGSNKDVLLRYSADLGYVELGTLGGDGAGSEHSPRTINAAGQITGRSETAKGNIHAFRWSDETGIQDLGTLGGWFSAGNGINAYGWVSGTAEHSNGMDHIFLSKPGESLIDLGEGVGGSLNDMGVILGLNSSGMPVLVYGSKQVRIVPNFGIANYSVGSLNDHNLFTGTFWNSRLGIGFTAIVGSERHGIVDLNKLISTNSGWVLTEATGMNNKCQVVGRGWNGIRNTMFRLDPIIPPLSIQHTGTNIMLTWTEAFFPLQVEESATLEDVFWQPVGGISTNTLTLPMAHFSRFYRLAIPSPPSP